MESTAIKEFDELNQYARHGMQLIVAWYTFFISANLFALGWFYTGGIDNTRSILLFRAAICPLFVLVNILGIVLCTAASKIFRKGHRRVVEIIEWISSQQNRSEIEMKSPVPVEMYLKAIALMRISLLGALLAWIVFFVIINVN